MKRILRIGLPNAGESVINWVANFFLLNIVNRTAPVNVAAAAHTNSIRIESISYMTGFAVAVADDDDGRAVAGDEGPAPRERSAYLAYAIGGGFMTFIGLMFIFFSHYPADDPFRRSSGARSHRQSACRSPASASPASPRPSSSAAPARGWRHALGHAAVDDQRHLARRRRRGRRRAAASIAAGDLDRPGVGSVSCVVLMWMRFATGKWKHIQV